MVVLNAYRPTAPVTLRIFRTVKQVSVQDLRFNLVGEVFSQSEYGRPIRMFQRQITFPVTSPTIEGVTITTSNTTQNLFIAPEDLTQWDTQEVRNLNRIVPSGTRISLHLSANDNQSIITKKPGSDVDLTVENGTVNFQFDFQIQALLGIFPQSAYDQTKPIDEQSNSNFLLPETMLQNGVIKHLPELLASDIPLAVVFSDDQGQIHVLTKVPGTDEPLRLNGNQEIPVDIPRTNLSVLDVLTRDDGSSLMLRQPSTLRIWQTANLKSATVTSASLNPLVSEGSEVLISWTSGGETYQYSAIPTEIEFVDVHASINSMYQYKIETVKQVRLGQHQQVLISSPPIISDNIRRLT